jgi:hypothetical protein
MGKNYYSFSKEKIMEENKEEKIIPLRFSS